MIHADLLDLKGTPFSITFVYRQPDHTKRDEVWSVLKQLKNISRPSWLHVGDFNQILSQEDKFSFNNRSIIGDESFSHTLNDLELCELESKGQRFTWMTRREDEAFVMERLDMRFSSVEWINSYPQHSLHNHPILSSDHGAINLDFERRHPFRRRLFRFEKMWLTHNDCKNRVQSLRMFKPQVLGLSRFSTR